MQHEITLGGDAPRSMLAGLRLQVEALEALGQTSPAASTQSRGMRRSCVTNRSDTHPHKQDRRSTFGRQERVRSVLDDKRTF